MQRVTVGFREALEILAGQAGLHEPSRPGNADRGCIFCAAADYWHRCYGSVELGQKLPRTARHRLGGDRRALRDRQVRDPSTGAGMRGRQAKPRRRTRGPSAPQRGRADGALSAWIKRFLISYLPQHRGASPHTVTSYGQALMNLFDFLAKLGKKRRTPTFGDLTAENVIAFLARLESERGNSPSTRSAGSTSSWPPTPSLTPGRQARTQWPREV